MPNGIADNPTRKTGLRFAAGLLLFCFLVIAGESRAEGEYLSPAAFLQEAFDGDEPDTSMIWLTGEKGDAVKEILGHSPRSLRVRYWQQGERTAWILDEIGREKPITAGFVIESGVMKQVRVLVFRESRGWEVRHEFFTEQFDDATLEDDRQLDRSIDNITGATMSVSAMKRMARVALYLDRKARED